MSEKTLNLGDPSGDGLTITIIRGFDDGTEEYTKKVLTYVCHGVKEIDVDDPWETGGGRCCHIRVSFSTGEQMYLTGVVKDVQNSQGDGQ